MKKVLLILLVLLLITAAVLLFNPNARAFLVASLLPSYPDWPAPQQSLAAEDSGEIYYATSSPYDLEVILGDLSLATPTTGLGYLTYPENAAAETPVPAMIIVPGSGGIAPGREHEYAAWFNAQGIAAFVVEYYAPRGMGEVSNYLARTSSVTEFDLIADAYSALKLLASSPRIDAQRIGLIGFSYGGMAARLAMDTRIHQTLAASVPPFNLHIDMYGPCFQNLQSTSVSGAPLLTLRGTEDKSNDLPACVQREDELRALGTTVTAHIYEGAGHAWEYNAPRTLSESSPYLSGCELKYDAKGKALLNGEALTEYAMDAPHSSKVLARLTSATKFKDCVGYGYVVGRDDATRDRGYADIQAFIQGVWNLAE